MAGRSLWNVTVLADPDPANAQPLVDTLQHVATYAEMQWGGALVAFGNRPGDVVDDHPAWTRASQFFHLRDGAS
jgi:hypothetical protein